MASKVVKACFHDKEQAERKTIKTLNYETQLSKKWYFNPFAIHTVSYGINNNNMSILSDPLKSLGLRNDLIQDLQKSHGLWDLLAAWKVKGWFDEILDWLTNNFDCSVLANLLSNIDNKHMKYYERYVAKTIPLSKS